MLFDRFKRTRAFIFAVDGVWGDGKVWVADSGDLLYRFHSKDDYAMQLAVARNYPLAVVGRMDSRGVRTQLERMGINDLFFGLGDRKAALRDWMSRRGLAADDVLCMGSDLADLDCLRVAGFPTCPADAAEEVKAMAAYISSCGGGNGAVRDVIEKVLKLQGSWA